LYFLTNFDLLLISEISASSNTFILLTGARHMFSESGLGIPFSFKTVIQAYPIPTLVNISSVL
jgi:hypothetical protein